MAEAWIYNYMIYYLRVYRIQSDQSVFCAPDHCNTESYKLCSNTSLNVPGSRPPVSGYTRLTPAPSVIPNFNYVIMVSDWNCTVIIRCRETFWSLCISILFWPARYLRCNGDVVNGCNSSACKITEFDAGRILQGICIKWGTAVPPYLQVIRSNTYRVYVKLWVIPHTIHNVVFVWHT
jgi:hypothetical protein